MSRYRNSVDPCVHHCNSKSIICIYNEMKMESLVSPDWTNVKFRTVRNTQRTHFTLLVLNYAFSLSTTFQNQIILHIRSPTYALLRRKWSYIYFMPFTLLFFHCNFSQRMLFMALHYDSKYFLVCNILCKKKNRIICYLFLYSITSVPVFFLYSSKRNWNA